MPRPARAAAPLRSHRATDRNRPEPAYGQSSALQLFDSNERAAFDRAEVCGAFVDAPKDVAGTGRARFATRARRCGTPEDAHRTPWRPVRQVADGYVSACLVLGEVER